MNPSQSIVELENAAARSIRVAVVADQSADLRRIERLLRQGSQEDWALVHRGELSTFWRGGSALRPDLVVIALEAQPGDALRARIDALTRSAGVAIIGEPSDIVGLAVADGMRARVCISRADLSSASLEAALSGLLRARASENRLLRVVADQSSQLQQLRSAGMRLEHEIVAMVEVFDEFARQIADLTTSDETKLAVAMDAVECLECATEEFDRTVKRLAARQTLLGPTNLDEVVETFISNLSGAGASKVSAMTSFDPIFVRTDGASLWRLLDCVLRIWREMRRPAGRLEVLTWDAGVEAKLAIVVSGLIDDSDEINLTQMAHRSSAVYLDELCGDIRIHARACDARVDANCGLPASTVRTFTVSLPKKPFMRTFSFESAPHKIREPTAAPL